MERVALGLLVTWLFAGLLWIVVGTLVQTSRARHKNGVTVTRRLTSVSANVDTRRER